jgi:hypothetical protein
LQFAKHKNIGVDEKLMKTSELLYYWFSIVGVIIALSGLLFIWFQFKLLRNQLLLYTREANTRFDYQRKEKAIEMAKEFSKFLNTTGYINSIMNNFEIYKLINKEDFDYHNLIDFDIEEVRAKFKLEINDIEIDLLLNKLSINEFARIYLISREYNDEFMSLYTLLNSNKFKCYAQKEIDDEKSIYDKNFKRKYNNELIKLGIKLRSEFPVEATTLLNKLEWFAMHFTTNLADDTVVYQSLHQVYLMTIKGLYFYIASKNTEGIKDKYYCHIIELYKRWSDQYKSDKNIEKQIEEDNKVKKNNQLNIPTVCTKI